MNRTWRFVAGVDYGVRSIAIASAWQRPTGDAFLIDELTLRIFRSPEQEPFKAWSEMQDFLWDYFYDHKVTSPDDRESWDAWGFIEEPPYVKSHRIAMLMGGSFGVIGTAMFSHDVEVIGVPVNTWKKEVVGKGNASKDQVREAVYNAYYPGVAVGEMTQDECDALAIMDYGLRVSSREWRTADVPM